MFYRTSNFNARYPSKTYYDELPIVGSDTKLTTSNVDVDMFIRFEESEISTGSQIPIGSNESLIVNDEIEILYKDNIELRNIIAKNYLKRMESLKNHTPWKLLSSSLLNTANDDNDLIGCNEECRSPDAIENNNKIGTSINKRSLSFNKIDNTEFSQFTVVNRKMEQSQNQLADEKLMEMLTDETNYVKSVSKRSQSTVSPYFGNVSLDNEKIRNRLENDVKMKFKLNNFLPTALRFPDYRNDKEMYVVKWMYYNNFVNKIGKKKHNLKGKMKKTFYKYLNALTGVNLDGMYGGYPGGYQTTPVDSLLQIDQVRQMEKPIEIHLTDVSHESSDIIPKTSTANSDGANIISNSVHQIPPTVDSDDDNYFHTSDNVGQTTDDILAEEKTKEEEEQTEEQQTEEQQAVEQQTEEQQTEEQQAEEQQTEEQQTEEQQAEEQQTEEQQTEEQQTEEHQTEEQQTEEQQTEQQQSEEQRTEEQQTEEQQTEEQQTEEQQTEEQQTEEQQTEEQQTEEQQAEEQQTEEQQSEEQQSEEQQTEEQQTEEQQSEEQRTEEQQTEEQQTEQQQSEEQRTEEQQTEEQQTEEQQTEEQQTEEQQTEEQQTDEQQTDEQQTDEQQTEEQQTEEEQQVGEDKEAAKPAETGDGGGGMGAISIDEVLYVLRSECSRESMPGFIYDMYENFLEGEEFDRKAEVQRLQGEGVVEEVASRAESEECEVQRFDSEHYFMRDLDKDVGKIFSNFGVDKGEENIINEKVDDDEGFYYICWNAVSRRIKQSRNMKTRILPNPLREISFTTLDSEPFEYYFIENLKETIGPPLIKAICMLLMRRPDKNPIELLVKLIEHIQENEQYEDLMNSVDNSVLEKIDDMFITHRYLPRRFRVVDEDSATDESLSEITLFECYDSNIRTPESADEPDEMASDFVMPPIDLSRFQCGYPSEDDLHSSITIRSSDILSVTSGMTIGSSLYLVSFPEPRVLYISSTESQDTIDYEYKTMVKKYKKLLNDSIKNPMNPPPFNAMRYRGVKDYKKNVSEQPQIDFSSSSSSL